MLVTVVSATTIHIDQHAQAIQNTMQCLPVPCRGLLISPEPESPKVKFDGRWLTIMKDWIPTGKWGIKEYCRFLLFGLIDYIETPFAIVVHADGYAVNRHNWDSEFLGYDYIGAPWPVWMNEARVGNGGFSLRSRRWLKLASEMRDWNGEPEDDWCCRTKRVRFEDAGMNIAPISIAQRWAIEHRIGEFPGWDVDKSFGFHGHFTEGTRQLKLFRE